MTRVPVRVADCFLLAHDDFMRRTRQGRHVSQSIIELDRVPDVARLRPALVRLVQKHPLLAGRLRRDWRTWLPYWEVPPAAGARACRWACGGNAALPALWPEATEIEDTMDLLQRVMTEPLAVDGIEFKARLDVVETRGWRAAAWRFPGRICSSMAKARNCSSRRSAGFAMAWMCPARRRSRCEPALTFKEKIQKTKAAVYRLEDLAKVGAPSLAGRGRGRGGDTIR